MVPARAGSKGLTDKNIRILKGLPLIAHSILPAVECNLVDEVFINSDSQEYLDIGIDYGAIGYLRDRKYAEDNTSMRSVLIDFINFILTQYSGVDAILVLLPTYPFRTPEDLSNIITAYEKLEVGTSLVGLLEPKVHPYLIYNRDETGYIEQYVDFDASKYYRRQDYPIVHELSHLACIVPASDISDLNCQLIGEKTFGYLINKHIQIVDVDTFYSNAEYVIACRLHANVVSLCCKSKVLAIATLDRIRELYRQYGIEQYCTDLTSDFKQSFDQLCKNNSVSNLDKINSDKLKTIKAYSGLLKKFGII